MSGEDLALGAQAFVAKETGMCRMMVREEVGGGEPGRKVVTCNMTSDADGLTNYRECS